MEEDDAIRLLRAVVQEQLAGPARRFVEYEAAMEVVFTTITNGLHDRGLLPRPELVGRMEATIQEMQKSPAPGIATVLAKFVALLRSQEQAGLSEPERRRRMLTVIEGGLSQTPPRET